MKTIYLYLMCALLTLLSMPASAKNIDLHIMAGQSNMQGWRSDGRFYPADPNRLDTQIPFYFEAVDYSSSQRYWDNLRPQEGHFQNGHFGPEVTFARAVKNYGFNPAIFKFSFGSSSIEKVWKAPGQNGLYDRMIRELQLSIKLQKQMGNTVNIRSFIWIQGETDASNTQLANRYYNNLKQMLNHFRRNVVKNPSLPVILGVDEQHPHVKLRPQVVQAQKRLSNENKNTAYTTMYGLEKADSTHLTAKGVEQHGQRIFQAYLDLAYQFNF